MIISSTLYIIACVSLCSLCLSVLFKQFSLGICLISFAMAMISLTVLRKKRAFGVREKTSLTPFDKPFFYLLLLIPALFFSLYYIEKDSYLATLHPYNFGDLSVHLQLIKSFVNGANFWPVNPIYPTQVLRYPFGVDLFSAHLEILKIPTTLHLFFFGIWMSYLLFLQLYKLSGIFAVCMFLVAGGFSFFSLSTEWHDFLNHVYFKNIFLSLWNTQRGFLVGFPLGFYVIFQMKDLYQNKDWSKLQSVVFGGMWGALTFFHIHSFLITVLVGLFYFCKACKVQKLRFHLSLIFISLLAVSMPFIVNSFSGLQSNNFIRFSFFWGNEESSIIENIFKNFSLWWVFYLLMLIKYIKNKKGEVVYYISLFILFHFLYLAPWRWDNIKVLVWLFLLLLPYVKKELLSFSKKTQIAVLFLFGFFGLNSLVLGMVNIMSPVVIADKQDFMVAQEVIRTKSPQSIFLTAPTVNHPLALAGGKILLGYSGHLWSHGIDYRELATLVQEFYTNPNTVSAQHLKKLGVNFVVWGPAERKLYKREALLNGDEQIYEKKSDWHIYSIDILLSYWSS